jgi:hypothetical protein
MNYPHSNIKKMIFSFEKHNATYFRVPKVASTSILISFRKNHEFNKVEEYNKNSFKFTFVRNPFDRLASCFRHVIQKGSLQNIQNHPELHKNMSFERFVEVVSNTKIENMDIHFRPQYTFLPETPDFIGKFENIQKDFKLICDKIKIKNVELRHENKTDKVDFEKYYNVSTAKKVLKLYEKDFDMFGYEKGIILN